MVLGLALILPLRSSGSVHRTRFTAGLAKHGNLQKRAVGSAIVGIWAMMECTVDTEIPA